ncbi:MAG: HAD hydrolase family protein [Ilumatobacteraceae bacterium]
MLVTDFDGVHTDDRAVVADDGSESVIVSRADGHGIKLLRRAGIPMLILSTETNGVVGRRAEKLGVECLQGIDDKWTALQHWLQAHDLGAADAAYVGNDVNDLECMAHVGLPIAVADADPIVRAAAAHVTAARRSRRGARDRRPPCGASHARRRPRRRRPTPSKDPSTHSTRSIAVTATADASAMTDSPAAPTTSPSVSIAGTSDRRRSTDLRDRRDRHQPQR